jgi:hypothetical protein
MADERRPRLNDPEDIRQDSLSQLDDFSRRLKVDKNSLDDELVDQPDVFYRVGVQYALAISRRDRAYTRRKEVEGEALLRVREREGRVTDTQAKELVSADPEVQAAYREYQAWASLASRWEYLKEAFAQRSYVLKDLAALWIAGYYAGSTGRAGRDAGERVSERHRAALDQERQRRRADS